MNYRPTIHYSGILFSTEFVHFPQIPWNSVFHTIFAVEFDLPIVDEFTLKKEPIIEKKSKTFMF